MCIKRGTPFSIETDHALMRRTANHQFLKRPDVNVLDMSKTKPREDIISGQYSAHEGRFEAYPASGFCGGTIAPSSLASPAFTRVGTAAGGTSTQSAFARTTGFADTRYSLSESRARRPIVAHLPNTPSIRIGDYAKRTPRDYFHLPGKAPLPTETAGHGGLYYDCQNYDKVVWSRALSNTVPFGRATEKAPDRRERIKYIEAIVKRAKLPERSAKKNQQRNLARENAHMLVDAIFKDKKSSRPQDDGPPQAQPENVFTRLTARSTRKKQPTPKPSGDHK